MKSLVVFGTRPEVIKLAPVIWELKKQGECRVCCTGQHEALLRPMVDLFGIMLDDDCALMEPRQSLNCLSSRMMLALEAVYARHKPDVVIVQGDTTTAMVASLVAFHMNIPVAHVEAGLRTYDMQSPFPEEANRVLISRLARWHFCPTEVNQKHLLHEGIESKQIVVTGNTVIDTLTWMLTNLHWHDEWAEQLGTSAGIVRDRLPYVLLTGHRRESFGEGFERICQAIQQLAHEHPDMAFIYPVHLNPQVRASVLPLLGEINNVHLIEPLDYPIFIHTMSHAQLILTDSGGVQEEASALRIPILIMRDKTERVELIHIGQAVLVGTSVDAIVSAFNQHVHKDAMFSTPSINPYGDGQAAHRIASILQSAFAEELQA